MPQILNTIAKTELLKKRDIRLSALLLVAYIIVYQLGRYYLPDFTQLFPATALALCALFFGGLRLWPAVYLTALLSAIFAGVPAATLIVEPVAVTLQAVVGVYVLHTTRVDTLFRRYRDMFYLIVTILLISLIPPTFDALSHAYRGLPYELIEWRHAYVASIFCLLIISPFVLRWLTKITFRRSAVEIYETLAVFSSLIAINLALFVLDITAVLGIPVVYILLIPLFLIALRLRPRFVTLALVITSAFAMSSVLPGAHVLDESTLATELFLIALATIFYIIVSLEEDRRVNTNIMYSQLETLQNAIARIRSESEAKNNFMAILGHELRNPLAPIASGIETLSLKNKSDSESTELLDVMSDRMRTVRRLLDELLDISRISEGKVAIKSETVDLGGVLERAILSTEHHRKELHQSLEYTAPTTAIYVAGDAMRLEQVFSNLLTNASKFSDSGDSITLLVRKQDRVVEIEIGDEGIGLNPGALESIFLPFNQVENASRTNKGLGIGLALVRSFVELHRGSVAAESRGIGSGSRFVVRLPILFPSVAQKKTTLPVAKKAHPHNATGLHILVVDDNDAAAAGMGRLLELKGCTVSYAYTGIEAIEKALSITPDVVLLDVGLPDIDGYGVTKTLRERGYTGRLIALSGYSAQDAREKGQEAGFDHYLVKPAGLAELRTVIPELT